MEEDEKRILLERESRQRAALDKASDLLIHRFEAAGGTLLPAPARDQVRFACKQIAVAACYTDVAEVLAVCPPEAFGPEPQLTPSSTPRSAEHEAGMAALARLRAEAHNAMEPSRVLVEAALDMSTLVLALDDARFPLPADLDDAIKGFRSALEWR